MAHKRSSVISAHIDDNKPGAIVHQLDSVTGRDLGGSVDPAEGTRGSRGGTGETNAAELRQVCHIGSDDCVGNVRCGLENIVIYLVD